MNVTLYKFSLICCSELPTECCNNRNGLMKQNSDVQLHQYLNIAEVMSSMTAEPRVDQHSVQSVNLGLSLGLRHEGT